MQAQTEQTEHLISDANSVVHGPISVQNTHFHPELTAEGVSGAEDYSEPPPGGELPEGFDMNSWSSTLGETFAAMMQSEINTPPQEIELALNLLPTQDAEIHVLMEHINQLEQGHTNNNPINILAFSAPGASPTSQLPSSEAPSAHPHTVPTIHPEHQSYVCSWRHQGSDPKCDHAAPDRPAFLRHLGRTHQVSGAPGETITCQLLDSKTGSACKMPIKRGNFPRHADIHYPLRYQCLYCPTDKSFSRKDSWRKHVRTVHPQAPPAP